MWKPPLRRTDTDLSNRLQHWALSVKRAAGSSVVQYRFSTYTLLDDPFYARLTPVGRQQPLEGLADLLVGELVNLVLIPGDDLPRRIPGRIRPVLALQ